MRLFGKCIGGAVLSLMVLVSTAQTDIWKFTHLSTDQGLSTGTVNCVFRDSRGFVWIGTQDGLNQYDGYEIIVYRNDPADSTSIGGNMITAVEEDALGRLWIGTKENGVSVYDPVKETFFTPAQEGKYNLGRLYIRDILVDGSKVMIGSHGAGLYIYDTSSDELSQYTSDGSASAISSNVVFTIQKSAEGKFLLGTQSNGLDLFDLQASTFRHFVVETNQLTFTDNRKPILQDKNGDWWMGTDGRGFFKLDSEGKILKHYAPSAKGLQSGIITCFYTDNSLIYVGTDGKGIHVLDPEANTFKYIQNDLIASFSLSSDAIYDIYKDYSGILWVSTFRGGVNIYSPKLTKFGLIQQVPYDNNSLSFNSVIGLGESADGSVWIGTDGGGLDRFYPQTGQIKHYLHDANNRNTISGNVIKSVYEDSKGNLWAGTYAAGLNKMNLKSGQVTRYFPDQNKKGSLPDRNVWTILEDEHHEMWFGVLGGGLVKYLPRTESFEIFRSGAEPESLASNLVVVLMQDSKNQFWVGTEDGGLHLFDRQKGTFRRFQHNGDDSLSLLNNNVRSLMQDKDGALWIGTADGINIMDINTFSMKAWPHNAELENRVINGLKEDANGNVWISTNKGLMKYDTKDSKMYRFTSEDGIQGNEFNYTTSIRTKNGMMYFGGLRGLNYFDPAKITVSSYNPQVVFTEFKILDQSVTQKHKINGRYVITSALNNVQEIRLKHDEKVFAIEFASLDLAAPLQNQYKYMLEGFDEDWKTVDATHRVATYTNLDAGTYTFRVRGTNSDGQWSDQEKVLSIVLMPAWWATWWFRGGMFLLISATAIGFYRWRNQQIKVYQDNLKQRVDEATSKVQVQNEALVSQQDSLNKAIEETKFIVSQAVDSGNFQARIDLSDKSGAWRELGESVNELFESILLPLRTTNAIINGLANSDLSLRYEADAKGDIQQLKDNMNHALVNLSGLLSDIVGQVEEIGRSSFEMSLTSQEMNASTGEIAASINEMSKGASDQVLRIDESSQLMEGIFRFSNDMNQQAQSINQAASRGVDQSQEGITNINMLDQQMKGILRFSSQTNSSMELLTNRSKEIARVLNLIKEVASETNLLALNATIEAAKAGDAGKGFAVVAEQIRLLAENSARGTKEIESMISEVQNAVKSTALLVKDMGQLIVAGEEASKKASSTFEELAASYNQTYQLSEGIVQATRQQSDDLSRVVSLMEGVVVIAEQTASGTEEVAASAAELSTGMGEFDKSTQNVMTIAEDLKQKVSQFKLEVD